MHPAFIVSGDVDFHSQLEQTEIVNFCPVGFVIWTIPCLQMFLSAVISTISVINNLRIPAYRHYVLYLFEQLLQKYQHV